MHVLSSLIGLFLLVGAASANAEPRVRDVPVRVASMGKIIEGGSAAVVKVATVCPRGWEVLESFVYLVQDGNQSLEGFFSPALLPEPLKFSLAAVLATGLAAYLALAGRGATEAQSAAVRPFPPV